MRFKLSVLFLIGLFLLGTCATVLAASENWLTDPESGVRICVVLGDAELKPVSASWSGPAAGGLAAGQGTLRYTYRDKRDKEITVQAVATMKAGKLDGKASVHWSDGSSFEGFYKDGLRAGTGIYKAVDGVISAGEWKNDQLNGKGRMLLPGNRSYEGDFTDNLPNGHGVYRLADGRSYEGQMVNAVFQGKGVMRFLDGTVYSGDWANGVPHGHGSLKLPDGSRYEGDFADGKRTGKGMLYYADGTCYEGAFVDGLRQGSGTLYAKDDKTDKNVKNNKTSPARKVLQQGLWDKDQFTGSATVGAGQPLASTGYPLGYAESWTTDPKTGCKIGWVSNEGWAVLAASWTGPIAADKAEGKGLLTFSIYNKNSGAKIDGTAEGEMKAGKLDGWVAVKWSDGDSYEGNYKEGRANGKGTYIFASGRVYSGGWLDGQQHGQGVMKNAAGEVEFAGEWKNGQPPLSPKAAKVLGVPWGATEAEAKKALEAQPGVEFKSASDLAGIYKEQVYFGLFNYEPARFRVLFHEGKLFAATAELFANQDELLTKLDQTIERLSQLYGPYSTRTGIYLDTKVLWKIGGGYVVTLSLQNEVNFASGAGMAFWKQRPLGLLIAYAHLDTWNKVVLANPQQPAHSN